jgi:hypothetical protein
MPTYPRDRFDDIPSDLQRVGAHRSPRPRGRGWVTFAWAALITGIFVGVGVIGMSVINDRVSFNNVFDFGADPTQATTPPPTVVPVVDPAVDVIVLNGTATDGLATQVGDLLVSKGWTVSSRSNASDDTITTTTIYYADPAQEAAALGLAQSLGNAQIKLSTQFAIPDTVRIAVVLGSDYKPAA